MRILDGDMAQFFPRHTADWRIDEPAAFRKLSLSLPEMALLAGTALRLYRAIMLGMAARSGWLALGAGVALGVVFLMGMTAAHLGNYPVHRWLWRAPAFGALVGVAESLTSLALTLVGREPLGSASATLGDWPATAARLVATRTLAICLFAVVLALVVQGVRTMLVRREHRAHTLRTIHLE